MTTQPAPAPQPVPQAAPPAPSAPAVPPEIKGFNFGAFALNWIWAIGNRTWLGLIAIVPAAQLVMAIILGIYGSEWAWKARKWDSVEHFKRVQRIWKWAGIGVLCAALVIGVISGIVTAFLVPYSASR